MEGNILRKLIRGNSALIIFLVLASTWDLLSEKSVESMIYHLRNVCL